MTGYPPEDAAALAGVRRLIDDVHAGGSPQILNEAIDLMLRTEWRLYIDPRRSEMAYWLGDTLLGIGAMQSNEEAVRAGLLVVDTELSRIPDHLDLRGETMLLAMRGALLAERYHLSRLLDDLAAALQALEQSTDMLRQIPDIVDGQTRAWTWWTYAHTLTTKADLTHRLDLREAVVEAYERAAEIDDAKPRLRVEIRANLALARLDYWQRAALTEDGAEAEVARAVTRAIAELSDAASSPHADRDDQAVWRHNIVQIALRHGEFGEARLPGLLDHLDQALSRLPEWDAGRARVLATRAELLHRHAEGTGAGADRAAADEAMRAAYQEAARFGGRELHVAAAAWAPRAAARGEWAEAARVGEESLTAAELLVRRQTHLDHKRAVLRGAVDIAGTTADALRRCGRPAGAVAALERGQAMVLGEQYARPSVIEDALRRSGRDDEADEYRARATEARRLNASDEELRAAQERLEFFAAGLTDIPGLRAMLEGPVDPVALLTGAPAVYLATGAAAGFALVLDGTGGATGVDLPDLTPDRLWRRAATFRAQAVVADNPVELRRRVIARTCQWLDRVVMGPLEPALAGLDRVTLVPTGLLAGLPLHAAGGTDRTYTYLPAAVLARPVVGGLDRGLPALVVADPRRTGEEALPGTRIEATALRRAFPNARSLTGRLASGAAVRDALPGSALIHLGCHATSDTHDVLDSALLLAGEDLLPLRELLASPAELLRAQLVVLSACQTSVLDRELPGESLNLTSGVLAAGANAVIGSLWPVDDAATATLMRHFYEALRGGTPPADALREAQRATAAEPGRSDPYFWAGFTYVGR